MRGLKRILLAALTPLPSFARVGILRLLGFPIGRGCYIAPFSVVVADEMQLGPGAIIEAFTLIYCPRRFVMGERSRIASFVRIIGFGTVLLGPQTFVALCCLIEAGTEFELKDRSLLGPRGLYYTHGDPAGLAFRIRMHGRNGPIRIGPDAWVGMGCILYPNITIGERAVVFAGAIVTSSVPPRTALVPSASRQTNAPLSVVQFGVTDEILTQDIEKAFIGTAGFLRRARLDRTDEGSWEILLPAGRLVLLRHPDATVPPGRDGEQLVLWRLHRGSDPETSFIFSDLSIAGNWSPLADRVAAILLRQFNMNFRFETPGVSRGPVARVDPGT